MRSLPGAVGAEDQVVSWYASYLRRCRERNPLAGLNVVAFFAVVIAGGCAGPEPARSDAARRQPAGPVEPGESSAPLPTDAIWAETCDLTRMDQEWGNGSQILSGCDS